MAVPAARNGAGGSYRGTRAVPGGRLFLTPVVAAVATSFSSLSAVGNAMRRSG